MKKLFIMKENNNTPNNQNKVLLIVIVNGEPVEINANVNSPLTAVISQALDETENSGREPEDWQLKWNGQILDAEKKVGEFEFQNGTELFLSLKAGVGG